MCNSQEISSHLYRPVFSRIPDGIKIVKIKDEPMVKNEEEIELRKAIAKKEYFLNTPSPA